MPPKPVRSYYKPRPDSPVAITTSRLARATRPRLRLTVSAPAAPGPRHHPPSAPPKPFPARRVPAERSRTSHLCRARDSPRSTHRAREQCRRRRPAPYPCPLPTSSVVKEGLKDLRPHLLDHSSARIAHPQAYPWFRPSIGMLPTVLRVDGISKKVSAPEIL